MKSIKTNPNSAKGPDKGKIVNKLYCILLTTLELTWLYFYRKKPDMKFIILVSNLKEISPSVFSWKKKIYKKKTTILSNYDSAEKRYINYAYVLKNGVGWFNIFFYFLHKSCWILCCFCVESVNIFIYNMCFFQQTISHMCKRFTKWGHCVGHQWSYDHIHEYMNIMLVNIEFFTGHKKIKQRHISFVPG
jgi:hypothetical protein